MPDIDVAILIVTYNSRADVDDCLGSLLASDDGDLRKHILVVDNASTDGTPDYIADSYPTVELLRLPDNLGFTGGNNRGWQHLRQHRPGIRYLYLLNPDTIVESGFLKPLVDYLDAHPSAGAAQSKLLLHPETDRLNSAGNRSHYLGFGYVTASGQTDGEQHNQVRSIDYASGAATIVRAALLNELGLFDDAMFLYLEDADLSWKLRIHGHDTIFIPDSRVQHKYTADAIHRVYYYLERNRWIMLLVYYRLPTLIALLPAILLMEAGQLVYAASRRMLGKKLAACAWFLKPANLRHVLSRRSTVQRSRTVPDRDFITRFAGTIDYPPLDTRLMRRIVNPLFNFYWKLIRPLIWW